MTLNQKALLQTIAIVTTVIGGSLGTNYLLSLLGPEAPMIASGIVLMLVFVYITFSLVKSRLEFTQKLEEINKK